MNLTLILKCTLLVVQPLINKRKSTSSNVKRVGLIFISAVQMHVGLASRIGG